MQVLVPLHLHEAIQKLQHYKCPEILRKAGKNIANTIRQVSVNEDSFSPINVGYVAP